MKTYKGGFIMYEKKITITRHNKDGSVTVYEERRIVEQRRFDEACKYEKALHPTKMSDIMDAYEEYMETLKF